MHGFDLDRIGGQDALDRVIEEVRAAGQHARALFDAGRAHVETKPDRSPVTVADREVEARLRSYVLAAFPDIAFRGEESGAGGSRDAALSWLLDPIDGTRAFIRGLPTWSVLLALIEDGEPQIAVGYFPADDDLYVAVRGNGAQRDGRTLKVSAVGSLADATITHGALAQHPGERGLRTLMALRDRTHTQRGHLDFDQHRQVLLGRIDVAIDPMLQPWDAAVPMLLIREAGGVATTLRGQGSLSDVVSDGGLVTSNGLVHAEMLELLRTA
jgi:histidinol phosphatase-like enzyme (inositol monophosphatase family)